jgi:hypothetical protein
VTSTMIERPIARMHMAAIIRREVRFAAKLDSLKMALRLPHDGRGQRVPLLDESTP